MNEYFENLLQQIDERIAGIDLNGANIISDSREMIFLIKKKLDELKTFTLAYTFKNEEEEIDFFKNKKPALLGRLMYFSKVYHVETHYPIGDERVMLDYLDNALTIIRDGLSTSALFYQYYRSGANDRDWYYFTRKRKDVHIDIDMTGLYFEADANFCTFYDYKVAEVLSTEMLYAYIVSRENNIKKMATLDETHQKLSKNQFKWTDSKATAVELVYAIYASGCLNKGTANLNEIAAHFELAFDIDLGDFYHSYLSLKGRKSSRTLFLDGMVKKLSNYMDKDDLK